LSMTSVMVIVAGMSSDVVENTKRGRDSTVCPHCSDLEELPTASGSAGEWQGDHRGRSWRRGRSGDFPRVAIGALEEIDASGLWPARGEEDVNTRPIGPFLRSCAGP